LRLRACFHLASALSRSPFDTLNILRTALSKRSHSVFPGLGGPVLVELERFQRYRMPGLGLTSLRRPTNVVSRAMVSIENARADLPGANEAAGDP